MTPLAQRHCRHRTQPLAAADIETSLADLPGWTLAGDRIGKDFKFANYRETVAFVNAVAWIAERENHHPDLHVGYDRCHVELSTHSAGGVSENDLILAARIEALFDA